MTRLRLVFADDHPLVLAGLHEFFMHDISVEIMAMVSSSTELIAAIAAHHPDVVVTDFSMPGDERYGDGLSFISYLLRRFPQVRVLVVTMVSSPVVIHSLYKAGVSGVVLKTEDMDKLGRALDAIRTGRVYVGEAAASIGVQPDTEQPFLAQLSPRELEVVRHFIAGQSLTDISLVLNRSIKTVSSQKRSAMRKLNAKNDQELIAYCVQAGVFQ